MSGFMSKSHDQPDETRAPANAKVEVVNLDGTSIARLKLAPGWRWSTSIKPVVGGDSCRLNHAGHIVSGRLAVRLDDGSEYELKPGDSYHIPPGHDAWVVGDETVNALEFQSAAQFASTAS